MPQTFLADYWQLMRHVSSSNATRKARSPNVLQTHHILNIPSTKRVAGFRNN